MKYIFEGTWIYLAHESQLPGKNDFFTTYMGRQPVFINRNKEGKIGGFINACAHRGAILCREKRGHRPVFACSFHGWRYNSDGELLGVKDMESGGYPDSFNLKEHGLTRIPKLASYRGFIFGSLNPAVPELEEHLADARVIIDSIVNQSPQGLEVLKGSSTYTFDGNWKMQAENGVDGYHVTTVHRNFVATTARRKAAVGEKDKIKAMGVGDWGKIEAGIYDFGNGHVLLWNDWPNPEDRPLYEKREEWSAKFGTARADWMIGTGRNLLIYPNVFLMDQMSSQIRHFRPLSVDKTEVTIYCFAPVGESAQSRERRIRQYEDFFNASGMATPDDLAEFEACQVGYGGTLSRWNDFSRGLKNLTRGPNVRAKAIGISPLLSGGDVADETIFQGQHRQWLKLMTEGLSQEGRPEGG